MLPHSLLCVWSRAIGLFLGDDAHFNSIARILSGVSQFFGWFCLDLVSIFCFKFIPHENELYAHTQPLCFVSPLILFCKFSRQILYVDVPAQNITNQPPMESVMLKANKCTDFYEIDFLRPFTDPWCLQPILEWIHRTKTEADVLWCVTQPSWICVEAKQSLLLWAVKESI